MKILEIVADFLTKTSLYEMARSRDDAKRLITGLSVPIFEHLIKLFVIPPAKTYWIKELDTYFQQIDDIYLKPSNKKIDSNTIYNWLVFDASPHYTSQWIEIQTKKMIQRNYQEVHVHPFDSDHLLNMILSIIAKVSKDISTNTFISIESYLR